VEGLKEKRGQLTGGNYCSIPGDQPQVGYGSSVPGAREDRTQGRWPGVQSRSIDVTKAGYAASGDVARTQVGHDSSVLGRNKKTTTVARSREPWLKESVWAGADEDRPCNASCTDDPKTTEKLL
jgi:hypothetical protein